MRKIRCPRLVPGRRERSAEPGDFHDRFSLVEDFDERPVVDVMQFLGQIGGGYRVEVVVVTVDPIDARAQRFVAALLVGDVADAQPERNLGMARDDRPRGVERAVDVAQDPEG
jgi:hypothetical protein